MRLTTGLILKTNELDGSITGTVEDDTLIGNIGENNLNGSSGDDILNGGKGNDTLDGDVGNDTYIWNLGDDIDTIRDTAGLNTIKFGENISFDDLTFKQDGNNLRLIVKMIFPKGLLSKITFLQIISITIITPSLFLNFPMVANLILEKITLLSPMITALKQLPVILVII